jgi:Arc/MetJ-type ribon-helix-helix transcriptional regulator
MVVPEGIMAAKIAISLGERALDRVDRLVRDGVFPSRSKLIQDAIEEKLARFDRGRLARECAKLDPRFEQVGAEEGLSFQSREWPEY